jgi:hypothetical protein
VHGGETLRGVFHRKTHESNRVRFNSLHLSGNLVGFWVYTTWLQKEYGSIPSPDAVRPAVGSTFASREDARANGGGYVTMDEACGGI